MLKKETTKKEYILWLLIFEFCLCHSKPAARGNNFKIEYNSKITYHNAAMEELDDNIFDVITKLWTSKRQPNENSVYNHILKRVELLTAIQLEAGALIKEFL